MLRHVALVTTLLLAAPVLAAGLPRTIEVHASCDVLGSIEFEGGIATLTEGSRRELDKVARTLDANPELRLVVESAQDAGLTKLQAQWRAAAVRAYFTVRGIDDDRLATRVVAAHVGSPIELVIQ